MDGNYVVNKNKADWDAYSDTYMAYNLSDERLTPIFDEPTKAFDVSVLRLIQNHFPVLSGIKVCVPSSGNNHAVFAFAVMGAKVTSCDISEKQLEAAKKEAVKRGIDDAIEFICSNTMDLSELEDNTYDLVYTSNGVHVWLNDINSMYKNIYRILKSGGINIMYDVHPFQRPYDRSTCIIKSYQDIGPIEDETIVNFHWRVKDYVNAIVSAGIRLLHMEEIMPRINYDAPFWMQFEDVVMGKKMTREEVNAMYDFKENPAAALPEMICIVGEK